MTRQEAIAIIKDRRKDLHISQTKIAEDIGTFKSDISNIEAGNVNITLDKFIAFCSALNLNLEIKPKT